jgi:hypothetical protein
MPRLHSLWILLPLLAGCVTHKHMSDYRGVPGIRGEATEWQRTTTYSVHLFFKWPIGGNSKPEHAVDEFMQEAAGRGATRIHLQDVDVDTYWWVLFPLSLIAQPVVTTVQGNVEGADPGR